VTDFGARRITRPDVPVSTSDIPYREFVLEGGVAGRFAKPVVNALGAISFALRGRGDRTAT
jgi:hypothetical protein